MATKTIAALLIATALPFSNAYGHSVNKTGAPITGYLCVMLAIGLTYTFFLVVRTQRKRPENHN
jgi:hypothetical protein